MVKKVLFSLVLMFFVSFVVCAEEVNLEWQKSWGGSRSDHINSIELTEDNGVIVVGSSLSTDIEGLINKGSEDATIVKYDKDGNMLWQKNWGGNDDDEIFDVVSIEDGGLIMVGLSFSTDIEGIANKGSKDAIILKYDKDGNMLWQKNWGGNNHDSFSSITLTKDNGFIVVGSSSSTDIDGMTNKGDRDIIIVKYDKDGNILWQKSWGGSSSDHINSIELTEEGGFIVVGYSSSTDIDGLTNKGAQDAIISKFDKEGNVLWQKLWGGTSNERFESITLTDDGVIATGYSFSTDVEGLINNGDVDAIIVKYDNNGNMLWQKNWGGSDEEHFSLVKSTESDELIAFGYSSSIDIEGLTNKGKNDVIIVKYDKDGNMLWQKNWGGSGSDDLHSIELTEDDGLIAAGYTKSSDIEGLTNKGKADTIVVKYDKDGNMLWQKILGGSQNEQFHWLILTKDNGLIAAGYLASTDIEGLTNNGGDEALIVKYSIEYNLENITSENGTFTVEQQGKYGIITPVSNEGYIVGKVVVKDTSANEIQVTKLENGTYSFEVYSDVIVEVNFVKDYSINLVYTKNGDVEVNKIDGGYGLVSFKPKTGFEFDKIVVKNSKDELVEVTKLEDGTYSFELYDDVTVEVLFKEKLVNPKTGVVSYIGAVLSILFISIATFCVLVFSKKSYRL